MSALRLLDLPARKTSGLTLGGYAGAPERPTATWQDVSLSRPPAVEGSLYSANSMLNTDSTAMRNLSKALREQDDSGSFDRCTVGSYRCHEPPIKAHAIPRSALKLTARSNKVYATNANPPATPIEFFHQDPLSERSIEQFSAGKWTCRHHDRMFDPIDSRDIDVRDRRNLFLIVYRTTLRLTQFALRAVGRVVSTMIDPGTPIPEGIGVSDVEHMTRFAIESTPAVASLLLAKVRLDTFLRTNEYHRLDYRVVAWETRPAMASLGIQWDNGNPVWVVVLPQTHRQVFISARFEGFGAAHPIDGSPEGKIHRSGDVDDEWTKRINISVLKSAADLAIHPAVYEGLEDHQALRLQAYLGSRSISPPTDVLDLPNLLRR